MRSLLAQPLADTADNRTIIAVLADNDDVVISSRESSVSSVSPRTGHTRLLPESQRGQRSVPPRSRRLATTYSKSLVNLSSPPGLPLEGLGILGDDVFGNEDSSDDEEDDDVIGPSLVSRLSVTAPGLPTKDLFWTARISV